MKSLYALLDKKSIYYLLLAANLISALAGFYLGLTASFYDATGYWNMGKSFGHGTFSSWYFLPISAPETLRTWGYPFFIFLCQQIYDSYFTVQIIQFLIYGVSIYLVLRLIKHFNQALIYRNVFLLFLALNLKIPFYAGQINAEMLCVFFIVLYAFIYYVQKESVLKSILLALCGFCLFQLRPAFLLFPVFFFVYKLIFKRDNLKLDALSAFLYLILLLPFGFWNYSNHGVFKVTPLEGGAGILHLGYWCPKLPENYKENFYWGNVCVADYTQPSFVSAEERQKNVEIFENEWREINGKLEPFFTDEDKKKIALMRENNPGQFVLYSGAYTNEREKLLNEKTFQHVKEDFWFYTKTRLYTFCRLWFTGINKDEWNNSSGLSAKAKLLYPFLSSFVFTFLGLIFAALSLVAGIIKWKDFYFLFLLTIYYGLIHTPFAFQARFTVPVHLLILLMSGFAFVNIIFKKYTDNR
ncbi:MAG TPA: hypothetical protein VGC76_10580 [Pyrinomonadaceae bacterium]|jgi:hypothetical protein